MAAIKTSKPKRLRKPSQEASHEAWQEYYRQERIRHEIHLRAHEYWFHVFALLDNDDEIGGDDAGAIAQMVTDSIESIYLKREGLS